MEEGPHCASAVERKPTLLPYPVPSLSQIQPRPSFSIPCRPPARSQEEETFRSFDETMHGHPTRSAPAKAVLPCSMPSPSQIHQFASVLDDSHACPQVVYSIKLTRSSSAPFPLPYDGPIPSLHGAPSEGSSAAMTHMASVGSPPPPPPQRLLLHPPADDEVWLTVDLGHFAYCGAMLVGTLVEIKDVVGEWGLAAKVVFGIVALGGIGSLSIGLMTAGYRMSPMNRRPSLSAVCARLSTILSTALFIVVISCKFGRIGSVAGVTSAVVIASIMTAAWVPKDLAIKAVSKILDLLWRRREEPAAAQTTDLTSIRIQK